MDQSHSQRTRSSDSPRVIHPSFYQKSRRRSRSASPKKDLRSDISSLVDSQSARIIRPKDFRTPLTCFFWHHTGDCKKSDNQCLYAHYHTGLVAEPPISYQGKAMGGATAKKVLGTINQREQEVTIRGLEIYDAEQRLAGAHGALAERENAVAMREQAVYQREQAVIERENTVAAREQAAHERESAFAAFEEEMLRKLEEGYHGIASTVQQIRRAVGNAQRVLANRRAQVLYHENFSDSLQGARGQGRYGGSIAIDGAIGAMGGLGQQLSEAEIQLTNQIHNAIRIE